MVSRLSSLLILNFLAKKNCWQVQQSMLRSIIERLFICQVLFIIIMIIVYKLTNIIEYMNSYSYVYIIIYIVYNALYTTYCILCTVFILLYIVYNTLYITYCIQLNT